MTEEEYFRKNYPDSCYGDRPLSPYWDFFQDGVEFGERQSEKKIEELENKIADIKANCDLAIEGRDVKIKELEKDNRLLEQRGSDILKELLDKNKRCMELEKQNVELEKENEK